MKLSKLKLIKQIYSYGNSVLDNTEFTRAKEVDIIEVSKTPHRYDIINYLIKKTSTKDPVYLEIGVRNPTENYDKIICKTKYSVDPGIEFKENPVDFKITSDEFFHQLSNGEILSKDLKFDVIFIDGMHLADQVERDIQNALEYIKPDGFIVLHDCNPPTEYHAREDHNFRLSPALNNWNGTTWKAFFKARLNPTISCCCIDSDWGVGIITKKLFFTPLTENFNPFYEFKVFEKNRLKSLNLMSFEEFSGTI